MKVGHPPPRSFRASVQIGLNCMDQITSDIGEAIIPEVVDETSVQLGLTKFDSIREHDTNQTRFLRVWVEYNRVWVIFVLTRLTHLMN